MNAAIPPTSNICPLCGGSGWQSADVSGYVRPCECRYTEGSRRLLQESKIPKRYEECSFDNYKTTGDDPTLVSAKRDVQTFLKKFPEVDFGLLLVGSLGVGKTHLAVALLKGLILEKRCVGLFYDFRDLLRDIQMSWDPVAQTSELVVIRPVLQAEVLVLDELGANKPTEWARDMVAHIINTRYNDKKLTIFTTNYLDKPSKPGEETLTDRIGARMRSRLYEMCKTIEMKGEDFRRNIRQANYRF